MNYNQINNILKKFTPEIFKRFLFGSFIFFLFLYYQSYIQKFIDDNFISNYSFLNGYLLILFLLAVFSTCIFIIYRMLKYGFIPSYSQILLCICVEVILCYYEYLGKWAFVTFKIGSTKVAYATILTIPIILFLILSIVNYNKAKKNKSLPKSKKNIFQNDDPIIEIGEDKLESTSVADSLYFILLNERHGKSFSIGLVGPWGNGKSSVIHLTDKKIKEEVKKRSIENLIIIHFLPYLNHKEEDIINEFFTILSKELANYSGKLSDQILKYAEKLTSLYEDKNFFGFLEKHITKSEKTSACELYNEINETLNEINQKIIVFVDDLDRLNENEILQVLKLIRNTANFKNTIFVVAMDKEYVLSRLKSDNNILNTNFIDKFFQLEVYLPEIDNSILRNYFVEILMKSNLGQDPAFEAELIETMSNIDNLFNDYVKNIRDVKRVTNQIIYDYQKFKKEIDFKDFLNFTYFKLKFPKVMKDLSDRKASFIEVDTIKGTYNLKRTEETRDVGQMLNKKPMHSFEYLEKYEIYKLKQLEVCKDKDLSINCEDQMLLVKTLAFLFGDENTTTDVSSIKNENNFRMLMQQRIFSNYFSQVQFEQLYDGELDTFLLVSINAQEKLPQLLNRLKFYNTEDQALIKRTMEILVELYDKREQFNLYDQEILLLVEEFVQRQFKVEAGKKIVPSTFPDWLKINIFDNENLSLETRLLLFGFIGTTRAENANWNISFDYINKKVIVLFTRYMDSFRNNLWKVHQYPVYRIYHSIKIIGDLKSEINQIFITFWKDHIEFFCAQTTDLAAFSNNRFNIADTVTEFFGSKQDFVDFVRVNKDDSKGVHEFLQFFDLLEKANYEGGALYEFQDSELMKEKINVVIQSPGRSNYNEDEKVREVFFETNNDELASFIVRNIKLREKYPIGIKTRSDIHYLIVRVNRKEEKTAIANFMNEALDGFGSDILPVVKPSDIKPGFEVIFMDIYFKIYSIEPKIKNI